MTIFYRDRLGKYPYLSRDGRKVNGGIPQLGDLSAHLSRTVTQVTSMLQPDFRGLAVIDWEEWRPLWGGNFGTKIEYRRLSKLLVREERPDLSEREIKSMARKRFEESARRFMEETLRTVVRYRPNGLWGFYGFPACLNKKRGKKGRTKTKLSTAWLMVMTFFGTDVCLCLWSGKIYTGRCHRGTKKQNDWLCWLWCQSTALYPSIYLPQRLAGSKDAALMVRYRELRNSNTRSLWNRGCKWLFLMRSFEWFADERFWLLHSDTGCWRLWGWRRIGAITTLPMLPNQSFPTLGWHSHTHSAFLTRWGLFLLTHAQTSLLATR